MDIPANHKHPDFPDKPTKFTTTLPDGGEGVPADEDQDWFKGREEWSPEEPPMTASELARAVAAGHLTAEQAKSITIINEDGTTATAAAPARPVRARDVSPAPPA